MLSMVQGSKNGAKQKYAVVSNILYPKFDKQGSLFVPSQ